MIRYSLKCAAGHGFDSWFQNAAAFGSLQAAHQLACPVCGETNVDKDLMAPTVRPGRQAEAMAEQAARAFESQAAGSQAGPTARDAETGRSPAGTDAPSLSTPASELEAAIAALRKQIAENSEYVGLNFAAEARRIHEGDAPERAIHGEARLEEARKLIEDGVPVAPLPFMPTRKVN